MSWLNELGTNLKKIVLMEHKIEKLGEEVKALRADVLDHGHRIVRIETMIEMARGGRDVPSRREIDER